MGNNTELSLASCDIRMAVHAFHHLQTKGQVALQAMLGSNTRNLLADKEDTVRYWPADAQFKRPRKYKTSTEGLQGLDFRVLLGLARAGFGEMPKEEREDGKERYQRFWIPDSTWGMLEAARTYFPHG